MRSTAIGVALALSCAGVALAAENGGNAASAYDAIIAKHARANGVPETLVRRIIVRESRYNPRARNGPYWGMMQLSVATARCAGFRGQPTALLDPDVNLAYGVRYLAGAYKTAGGNHDRAVGYYARGYYYAAKSKGMLAAIGMGRDGRLTPAPFNAEAPVQTAAFATPPATAAVSPPSAARPVPTPPVRAGAPAQAVAPTVVTAAAPQVPLPPVRGASPAQPQVAQAAPAVRSIDPKTAAPVMASIVPVPRPRDEPATTGSVTPRSSATQKAPVQGPQLAAASPAIPVPQARDSAPAAGKARAPQSPLAFAEPAKGAVTPFPQPRGAPLPPRR